MQVYIERNNVPLELVDAALLTFTFAKQWVQCNIAHRTQIRRFRTKNTSAPFLTG